MCRKHCIGKEIKKLSHMILRQFLAYETARGREDVTKTQGHVLAYLYKTGRKGYLSERCGGRVFYFQIYSHGDSQIDGKKRIYPKEPVEQDGRLKRLVLTEQGKSGHQQVIEDIQYLDARLMDGISRKIRRSFGMW